jgi:hypothetical protein
MYPEPKAALYYDYDYDYDYYAVDARRTQNPGNPDHMGLV